MSSSYIYFIQAKGNGPIKIGFTADDPRKRMVKIQSDCPWPVDLIGAIEGTLSQEKQIHDLLSYFRTQGEWFAPHPKVVAAVQEALKVGKPLSIESKKEKGAKYDHALCRYRAKHKITLKALSKLTGISHGSLSRYESGRNVPSGESLKSLIEITGLDVLDLRPDLAKIAAGTLQ